MTNINKPSGMSRREVAVLLLTGAATLGACASDEPPGTETTTQALSGTT